jgi:DNA-binding SARP family transcriptional activator
LPFGSLTLPRCGYGVSTIPRRRAGRYDFAVIEHRRLLAHTVREAIACAEIAHEDRSLAHLYAASKALHDTSRDDRVVLDLISGSVFGPSGRIALTRAALAVVILLAIHEHGLSREQLTDTLYPDADPVNGWNAVKETIHRARRRIGIPDAIRRQGGLYALGEIVDIEFRRVERQFRSRRTMVPLDREAREELEALRTRLIPSRPAFMQDWSWFQPTERRLRKLYRDIAVVIARDAMRAGRLERAIELAMELTDADPLDEEAAELGIRAFLQLGDRTSALLAYRRYAVCIRHELSLSPPRTISALLG